MIYPKGVWSKDDFLPMYLNRNSAGDSFVLDLDPGQKVVQLPLTTIDKIVAELSLPRVDFIKMDIKGAEVQALQGAGHTLAVYQPRMSIASEHLETDPETSPRTVKLANSRYRVTCGLLHAARSRAPRSAAFLLGKSGPVNAKTWPVFLAVVGAIGFLLLSLKA